MGRDMGYEQSSKPSKVAKMNNRFSASLHNTATPIKSEKEKRDARGSRVTEKGIMRRRSNREKKMALQQDVDKLRRKLRHEQNVHRALERAFTRPLGVLPRLPPCLPQYTLELLAEVAVLEEEVVRLEVQIVNFRKGLYQEAVHTFPSSGSSKKQMENGTGKCMSHSPGKPNRLQRSYSQGNPNGTFLQSSAGSFSQNGLVTGKQSPYRGPFPDGNENRLPLTTARSRQSSSKISLSRTSVVEAFSERGASKRQDVAKKLQMEIKCGFESSSECKENVRQIKVDESNKSTKLSEDILKCLLSIFTRIAPSSSCGINNSPVMDAFDQVESPDPYGVYDESREMDVGPYKYLRVVSAASIDLNRVSDAVDLLHQLKQLLVELGTVDLRGLTHQQKLAFWINIYNSCMMNAFLEYGTPYSPHKIVELMHKAVLSVGGHILNALTIEHFILRLPYHSKHVHSKCRKTNEGTMRSIFGLEWAEPLVTFALSCGSWSSPAVRVYTAANVEDQLESAKQEYLQAAIGISTKHYKLSIPKLLDWYLLDFAKDLDSLLDWICLQLPSPLRNEAVKCLEQGRKECLSQLVQIVPYDFSFRYILSP